MRKHHRHPEEEEEEEEVTLLGDKGDSQGKELKQALSVKSSCDTHLLCGLGHVTAPL